MYIVHLAAQLSLNRPRPASAARFLHVTLGYSNSALLQLVQGDHELHTVDKALVGSLEKAFTLCIETCSASAESPTSWDAQVDPCLGAVLRFSTPAALSQVGDIALSHDTFCKYGRAYLWALGNAADVSKLHSAQLALRKKTSKKLGNHSEALQDLIAAAPAAMQLALEKQFSKLEPEVQAVLQRATNNAAAAAQSNSAPADGQSTIHLLHGPEVAPVVPAAPQAQLNSQGVTGESRQDQYQAVQDAVAVSQADHQMQDAAAQQHCEGVPEQTDMSAGITAEEGQGAAVQPSSGGATEAQQDSASRQLLAAVFDMLKRCYAWWKAAVATKTADAAQQRGHVDKAQADALLTR